MNILLCTLPEVCVSKDYLPHLSLLYVAAQAEKGGHKVKIIDSHIEGLTTDNLVKTIIQEQPDILGVTATSHNRFEVIKVLKKAKQFLPETITVAGGVHFTITAEDALKCIPELDVIVLWEGEYIFYNLANTIQGGGSFDSVNGIAFRKDSGEIIFTKPSTFIHNLDDLTPAWHLIDMDKYQARLEGTYDTRAIGVMSARGCPSSSVFCSNSIWGKKSYRMKSPLKFVDEIEFLYKKYGFKGFDFWDDTLTLSKNHILGICDEILRRELKIEWYARARVNTVNKEILLSMKRAGCVAIGYGIESGSPKVLEAIKKKITISQIKQAVKDTADIGIISKNFFMFSLPKEQEEDILMTINLMKELVSYSSTVTTPYALTLIYPGTELEKLAKSRGILSQNFSWNTYTEFSKSRLYGENKTIPFYEEQLSLEKVKSILRRNLVSKGDFFQKAKRRLSRIRNFHDILSSFKAFR